MYPWSQVAGQHQEYHHQWGTYRSQWLTTSQQIVQLLDPHKGTPSC